MSTWKPEFNPQDPYWWLREPEYKFPEIRTGEPMPTEQQELQFIAEELRTDTATLPRQIVERYVAIKKDQGQLRKFLLLLLDMCFDESLYAHIPGSQEESTIPFFDAEEEEEHKAWQAEMYAE